MHKQKWVFEVTVIHIWIAVLIVAFAMTIIFKVGVSLGERRTIKAQLEALRRNDVRPPDQITEKSEDGGQEPQYTLQVGFFSSSKNAENLVNSLKSQGYTSWMSPKLDEVESSYYVFVGKFDTADAAEQFGRLLQERLPSLNEYRVRKMQKPIRSQSGASQAGE